MPAKIRRDAKLKSLPVAQQSAVFEIAAKSGITNATLDRMRAELAIDVRSLKTLSEFWHWYQLPQQRISRELETAGSITALVVEKMRATKPEVSDEDLFTLGQRVFAERAIALQDVDAWVATQGAARDQERTAIKAQELELAKQKFQRETAELFLKWAEDQQAREITASGSTHAEKIERLGQLMFGEGWK